MPERPSVTDQLWGRIKNHPAAAVVIVLAAVLVGAAKVTGAVDDIITFLERRVFAGSTAGADSTGDLGASAALPDPGDVGFVPTLRIRPEDIDLLALECDSSHTLSCDDPFPFLTLGEVSYGRVESGQGAYLVEVTLSNASDSPILLDLDQRFFVLEDDQGRTGEMLAFCCVSRGGQLPAGERRRVTMVFAADPRWAGKETAAKVINFRVSGLRPVMGATWSWRPLATAA